jgi:hypothetical protein
VKGSRFFASCTRVVDVLDVHGAVIAVGDERDAATLGADS